MYGILQDFFNLCGLQIENISTLGDLIPIFIFVLFIGGFCGVMFRFIAMFIKGLGDIAK